MVSSTSAGLSRSSLPKMCECHRPVPTIIRGPHRMPYRRQLIAMTETGHHNSRSCDRTCSRPTRSFPRGLLSSNGWSEPACKVRIYRILRWQLLCPSHLLLRQWQQQHLHRRPRVRLRAARYDDINRSCVLRLRFHLLILDRRRTNTRMRDVIRWEAMTMTRLKQLLRLSCGSNC